MQLLLPPSSPTPPSALLHSFLLLQVDARLRLPGKLVARVLPGHLRQVPHLNHGALRQRRVRLHGLRRKRVCLVVTPMAALGGVDRNAGDLASVWNRQGELQAAELAD